MHSGITCGWRHLKFENCHFWPCVPGHRKQTWACLQGRAWPSKVSQVQIPTSPGSCPALPAVQVWLQHPLVHHSALVWTSDGPAAGLGIASLDWPSHDRCAFQPLYTIGLGSGPCPLLPAHWSWPWPPDQVLTTHLGPSNTQPRVQKCVYFASEEALLWFPLLLAAWLASME